jgi:hypothetical protein
MVYLVTAREALSDAVRAALKTNAIIQCPDSADLIGALLRKTRSKARCVIIDLASINDAEHLLTFIKSSLQIGRFPVVAVCSDAEYDALPETVANSLNGVIMTPYSPIEIAAVVESVCGAHDEGAHIKRNEPPPESAR